MIGLDTNVIVRYLTQDDEAQAASATRLISRLTRTSPGFVSAVVLAELSWVLTRAYKLSRSELASILESLLQTTEIRIENAAAAWRALSVYQTGKAVEFADALIAETAALAGARRTYTFDRRAAADSRMTLLE